VQRVANTGSGKRGASRKAPRNQCRMVIRPSRSKTLIVGVPYGILTLHGRGVSQRLRLMIASVAKNGPTYWDTQFYPLNSHSMGGLRHGRLLLGAWQALKPKRKRTSKESYLNPRK